MKQLIQLTIFAVASAGISQGSTIISPFRLIDLSYTGTNGSATATASFNIPVESDFNFSYGFASGVPLVPTCTVLGGCGAATFGSVSLPQGVFGSALYEYSCPSAAVDFGPCFDSDYYSGFGGGGVGISNIPLSPGNYTIIATITYVPNYAPQVNVPATNRLYVDAYARSGQIVPLAPTSAPEPASFAIFGSGVLALIVRNRRNQHRTT